MPEVPVRGTAVTDRTRIPLLELITAEAVDQDYRATAARRARGTTAVGAPVAPSHRVAATVVAVFGLLLTVAAVQTSENSEVQEASRRALAQRIDTRKEAVATLLRRSAELRRGNAALAASLVGLDGDLAAAQRRLQLEGGAAGFAAVSGPGLRVTVADSPDGTADGRVRASDLRLLVNGLWASGAEAMAVNGRRVTSVTGIVNADIAIQVNKLPLSPPYVFQVIGGPNLSANLQDSASGVAFFALARQFGFEVSRESVEELDLNAAAPGLRRVLYATTVQGSPPSEKKEGTP